MGALAGDSAAYSYLPQSVKRFPSPEELAGFLWACAEAAVNFKATAGLHGAVRHRDERTGFVHHGFLNLVLGTARAAAEHPSPSDDGARGLVRWRAGAARRCDYTSTSTRKGQRK